MLILACGLFALHACGRDTSVPSTVQLPIDEPVTPPVTTPVDPVTGLPCGEWLGSIDLAGTCRHNPPTSGALEVT